MKDTKKKSQAIKSLLLLSALLPLTFCADDGVPGAESAHAFLLDRTGDQVGRASLVETEGGVRIELTVSDLPPGSYGVQIHEHASCSPPGFLSAGEPYPPPSEVAMAYNANPAVAGPLARFEVGSDRSGSARAIAPVVSLRKGNNSLFHPGGTALILSKINAGGVEGIRVACGLISRADPETVESLPAGDIESAGQPDQMGTPGKTYRRPDPQ